MARWRVEELNINSEPLYSYSWSWFFTSPMKLRVHERIPAFRIWIFDKNIIIFNYNLTYGVVVDVFASQVSILFKRLFSISNTPHLLHQCTTILYTWLSSNVACRTSAKFYTHSSSFYHRKSGQLNFYYFCDWKLHTHTHCILYVYTRMLRAEFVVVCTNAHRYIQNVTWIIINARVLIYVIWWQLYDIHTLNILYMIWKYTITSLLTSQCSWTCRIIIDALFGTSDIMMWRREQDGNN